MGVFMRPAAGAILSLLASAGTAQASQLMCSAKDDFGTVVNGGALTGSATIAKAPKVAEEVRNNLEETIKAGKADPKWLNEKGELVVECQGHDYRKEFTFNVGGFNAAATNEPSDEVLRKAVKVYFGLDERQLKSAIGEFFINILKDNPDLKHAAILATADHAQTNAYNVTLSKDRMDEIARIAAEHGLTVHFDNSGYCGESLAKGPDDNIPDAEERFAIIVLSKTGDFASFNAKGECTTGQLEGFEKEIKYTSPIVPALGLAQGN